MSGLLAVDPGEPGAGESVEEKQARCPGKYKYKYKYEYKYRGGRRKADPLPWEAKAQG